MGYHDMTLVRVTVGVCPNGNVSIEDARAFAAYLYQDLGSLGTFAHGWQDANGNPAYAASAVVDDAWRARAVTPFDHDDRPNIDPERRINMTGARRAFDAMQGNIWTGEGAVPQCAPDRIVAVAGMPPLQALAAMGLVRVEVEI